MEQVPVVQALAERLEKQLEAMRQGQMLGLKRLDGRVSEALQDATAELQVRFVFHCKMHSLNRLTCLGGVL